LSLRPKALYKWLVVMSSSFLFGVLADSQRGNLIVHFFSTLKYA